MRTIFHCLCTIAFFFCNWLALLVINITTLFCLQSRFVDPLSFSSLQFRSHQDEWNASILIWKIKRKTEERKQLKFKWLNTESNRFRKFQLNDPKRNWTVLTRYVVIDWMIAKRCKRPHALAGCANIVICDVFYVPCVFVIPLKNVVIWRVECVCSSLSTNIYIYIYCWTGNKWWKMNAFA